MNVEFLTKEREAEYDNFMLKSGSTLFYASNKYRKLLKSFLEAEDFYFLAIDGGQIVGALPAFLKRNRRVGHILNSLPFFGSNGGIIEHEGRPDAKKALLNAFNGFASTHNCISTTIITSPFEADVGFYDKEIGFSHRDERIGQVTSLPPKADTFPEALMNKFDGVRRRNIRKALKSGVGITDKDTPQALQFLADTHAENIRAMGGIPKPKYFFELITKLFEYGKEYKIFTALKDNVPIAAVLLFYFNKTVEYFTPVVVERFRTFQPLSLIIYEAMQDAVRNGYKWWNWGGTWKSQIGVYRFKKKWGTEDRLYFYYTKIYNEEILHYSREQLLKEFSYFYVVPFNNLISK
ncbi:MAG: peptidoglycan bridge formation glycyltransferase FemA/FemB family protein [Candidatus Hodarchaeota archaeon]